jgi:MFS family permease
MSDEPAAGARPAGPVHAIPAPRGVLRALRSRNFRLYFGGQSLSLIGTWITRVATSWLVYRLTGSLLLLGVVGFFSQIPTLLLAPFAGVLVDRWDRHRILVITQTLSMLQSAALAWLTFAGIISVVDILVLQCVQGVINAFDTPARQAFVVQMVAEPSDLPNAIALNSTMVNGSRIIGPSISGLIIAATSEGWCFAIDAISYLAVIASLLAMRDWRPSGDHSGARMVDELKAGFAYVSGFQPVRTALLLLALISIMGMPYTVLMPAIASRVLHGGPHTLGFLMTATGLGAVSGALYLASRRSVVGLGRIIPIACTLFGVGLVAFSFSRVLWLSLAILPLVGGGFMVSLAATNTIIQTVVEDRLRGRVMAFFAMAFLGTAPIGSLISGVVADRIGAPGTIRMGGIACIAGAAWFAAQLPTIRRLIRPIYVERGIMAASPADAAVESS